MLPGPTPTSGTTETGVLPAVIGTVAPLMTLRPPATVVVVPPMTVFPGATPIREPMTSRVRRPDEEAICPPLTLLLAATGVEEPPAAALPGATPTDGRGNVLWVTGAGMFDDWTAAPELLIGGKPMMEAEAAADCPAGLPTPTPAPRF